RARRASASDPRPRSARAARLQVVPPWSCRILDGHAERTPTMTAFISRRTATAALVLAATCTLTGTRPQGRDKIADRYKWALQPLYPSDQAWRAAKEKFAAGITRMRAFKGTLASSPQKLADALDLSNEMSKEYARLAVYASLLSDQDTRVSAYQGMSQEM